MKPTRLTRAIIARCRLPNGSTPSNIYENSFGDGKEAAAMARVEKDFAELLQLFNKHRVRYCIVGAFAVGFYALPRYTKDLDIGVEPSVANGERICRALREFGFG